MKKVLLLALLSCFILPGCNNQPSPEPSQTNKPKHSQGVFVPLPATEVIESSNSGELKNIDRFNTFLENINEKEADHIQIIHFTTEGDPIYQDIQFDGTEFTSTVDNSRDKYGSGGITEKICTELKIEESDERKDYMLEGCEGQGEELLLVFWK